MPICEGCGGSYDDQFRFCPYCGRAKPEPVLLKIEVSVSSKDRWETCKVYRRICGRVNSDSMLSVLGYFWAEGIGADGTFFAGESPPFRIWESGYSGESIAHSFLLGQLAKQGWEATTSGGSWWEMLFRRRIGENHPEPTEVWYTDLRSLLFGKCYFTAYHAPSGQSNNFIEYGKSPYFKMGFLDGMGAMFRATDERKRIFDEFLQGLKQNGFTPVQNDENDKLMRCLINQSAYWYLHFLTRAKMD